MPRYELVTAPAVEPLLLEEAKDHLRESGDPMPQDTEIESRIQAAREAIEHELGRALITQTWRLYLDRFPSSHSRRDGLWDPGWITLPKAPIQAVTSVQYVAPGGTLTALVVNTDYVAQLAGVERHVRPAYSLSWPTPRDEPDAVRIEFRCGYGDSGDAVPEAIRNAMRLLVGDLYENREAQIVGTIVAQNASVERLLAPYRVLTVV